MYATNPVELSASNQASRSEDRFSISMLFSQAGLAMVALGIASGIPIQGLGRLYVGEVALVAIAPVVVLLLFGLTNEFGRMARIILVTMIISWLGYVLADFLRDTPSSDYLRGWSRWISMGAAFATLAWIGSKRIAYLAAFLVGLSIGSCVAPFMQFGFVGVIPFWKFYGGVPICILALVVASSFRPMVSVFTLVGLAAVSIALDTRSIALLCMLTAGVSWLAARRTAKNRLPLGPISKSSIVVASLALALLAAFSVFAIQQLGERYGYAERFRKSDSTRLISATVTWSAIQRSPLVGYGSWPRDAELARLRDRLVSKAKGVPAYRMASQDNLIIAHSQILQGWLEGGILGIAFFVVFGWQLAKQLIWQTLRGPLLPLSTVIVFVQLHSAWHLVFSPFSGAQRVYIPTACVFICYLAQRSLQLEELRRHLTASFIRRPIFAT